MRNIEIKAKSTANNHIRTILQGIPATFKGTDHQRDTYFHVPHGRLKLRDGNIEKTLISYNRANQSGPKKSDYMLYPCQDTATLRECLTRSLGILVDVKKVREIYYVGYTKIHLDRIDGLGEFVEIEARDETDEVPENDLLVLCNQFINLFGIRQEDLINVSYSDMLLSAS